MGFLGVVVLGGAGFAGWRVCSRIVVVTNLVVQHCDWDRLEVLLCTVRLRLLQSNLLRGRIRLNAIPAQTVDARCRQVSGTVRGSVRHRRLHHC